MNKKFIKEMVVFVLILLALNFFLHLHISIIGSVVITLVLSFFFGSLRSRRG